MNTENWIDIRKGLPEGRVIFLWDINHPEAFKTTLESGVSVGIGLPTHTHFHPAIIAWMPMPEFISKQPTQKEVDDQAFEKQYSLGEPGMLCNIKDHERKGWVSGIFYERSAIRNLIQRHCNDEITTPELIRLISERVKI